MTFGPVMLDQKELSPMDKSCNQAIPDLVMLERANKVASVSQTQWLARELLSATANRFYQSKSLRLTTVLVTFQPHSEVTKALVATQTRGNVDEREQHEIYKTRPTLRSHQYRAAAKLCSILNGRPAVSCASVRSMGSSFGPNINAKPIC